MAVVIGVDPGLNGALAELMLDGPGAICNMPTVGEGKSRTLNLPEIVSWFQSDPAIVVIEKVHAISKWPQTACFKFGRGYGQIEGVVAALGFPLVPVTPQMWKKTVLAGMSWVKNKECSLEYAMMRWPELSGKWPESKDKAIGIADALCIAWYGQMCYNGGSK